MRWIATLAERCVRLVRPGYARCPACRSWRTRPAAGWSSEWYEFRAAAVRECRCGFAWISAG